VRLHWLQTSFSNPELTLVRTSPSPNSRGVVRTELRNLASEAARVERVQHSIHWRRFELGFGDRQIVSLFAQPNGIQPIGLSRDPNGHSGVRISILHRPCSLKVTRDLVIVASHWFGLSPVSESASSSSRPAVGAGGKRLLPVRIDTLLILLVVRIAEKFFQ
jgi:hypothetical protein